jgi:hypothetical protein
MSVLPEAVNARPPPEGAGSAACARGRDGAGSSKPMRPSTRSGVSGRRRSAKSPSGESASATALATHTGVLMLLPSPRPLAPRGVNGDGVSLCRITASGTSQLVGTR